MPESSLYISAKQEFFRRTFEFLGKSFLFLVASASAIAVFFIFYFIAKDAIPFFRLEGFKEFFTSSHWYPSGHPAEFGALAIFYATAMVTVGAIMFAVPLAIPAAVCLSDILPFNVRQMVKPVVEVLAAIPSVAYGFFALVIFAPFLQNNGGFALAIAACLIGFPVMTILSIIFSEVLGDFFKGKQRKTVAVISFLLFEAATVFILYILWENLSKVEISSGTNALNVSIILGIMALPTIVSVSEDALQAVGRDLREGSYALGATRAETLVKVVMPAAVSGILAAVILGVMRVVGETMVVWMAAGNAAKLPEPFCNYFEPIRTLTATIAGDMGEADHLSGAARFHVLFAMALCLLAFSFTMNLITEAVVRRFNKKMGKS